MKIVVDINHPAHVHYFKHFIWEMESKGHQVLVTASEKDIALKLLDLYHIPYINMGSYGKGIIRKILNIPIMNLRLIRRVKNFQPDLFLGFGSIRATHAAKYFRAYSISLEDTEHSVLSNMAYTPFTDVILTPISFQKDFGKKQHRFNGTTDLLYLHPNRFTPDPHVIEELGLTPEDTFFIVRFVSFDANHDIGQSGIKDKIKLVKTLAEYGKVFITSEGELPEELEQYRARVSPEKMHHLMAYATLFVGESPTMASESATLGVHAVYISTLPLGYIDEEEKKYNLVTFFNQNEIDEDTVLQKIRELLADPELRQKGRRKQQKLLDDSDDVTEYLIKFVENLSIK